jgi:hypothetical protein
MSRFSCRVRFSFGRVFLATAFLDKVPDIGQPRRIDPPRDKKRRPTAALFDSADQVYTSQSSLAGRRPLNPISEFLFPISSLRKIGLLRMSG